MVGSGNETKQLHRFNKHAQYTGIVWSIPLISNVGFLIIIIFSFLGTFLWELGWFNTEHSVASECNGWAIHAEKHGREKDCYCYGDDKDQCHYE